MIDPRRHAAGKPLEDHLEDFEESLSVADNCDKHIRGVLQRIRAVFKGCGFLQWADIRPEAVESFLKSKRRAGEVSTQTSNHHLQAVKQFCRWMVNSKRAAESPLEDIERVDVERKRERRPLMVPEMEALLATTQRGPERFGMEGPERALLYVLAAETGFRARALRSLVRSSFDLTGKLGVVRVKATNSKRKKEELLPLRKATAEALRVHLADKFPSAPAFNMPSSDKTAKMLRADLDDARGEWLKQAKTPDERAAREGSDFLAYVDHGGYVADFHALRGTCGTNLQRTGAPLSMAQKILGHSTPELTANIYTRFQLEEQAVAMEALPSLAEGLHCVKLPPSEPMKATGTDGAEAMEGPAKGPRMLRACYGNAPTGQSEAQPGTEPTTQETENRLPQVLVQQAESVDTQADGEGFEPPGPVRAQQFSRLPP